MRRYSADEGGHSDLEGAGPGGGAEITREDHVEAEPGSRAALILTAVLVGLALLVPVLWAIGVYTRLAVVEGVDPAAVAGYFLLIVMLLVAAVLYFWKQFTASA